MRKHILALSILLCLGMPAYAQVSIGIGSPGISIGINMNSYPDLVPIPGYPVYYDPQVNSNYFFYDGQYWVYRHNNWYSSTWYNGPWGMVGPQYVPLFVLRVPVRYYRDRPSYFRGWNDNDAPRWGDHWGNGWAQQRSGWDNWNRNSVPVAAPLPVYQRQYSGSHYPTTTTQQNSIRSANYHYRSHESTPHANVTTQHSQPQARPTQRAAVTQHAPASAKRAQTAAQRQASSRSASEHAAHEQRAHTTQRAPVTAHKSSEHHAPVTQRAPKPNERVQHTSTPRSQQHAAPAQQRQAAPAHPVQQRPPAQQRPSAQERKPPLKAQPHQAKPEPKDKGPNKNDKENGGPDSH